MWRKNSDSMVSSVSSESVFKDLRNIENGNTESDIADILKTKGYMSQDPDPIKTKRNDEAHILSELSDDQLLKLLRDQSNVNENYASDFLNTDNIVHKKRTRARKGQQDDITINNANKNDALFKLENKVLKPQLQNNEEYKAWQKLNNLLTDLPKQPKDREEQSIEEEEKEILFDMLVQQLKSLCFKKKSKSVNYTLPNHNRQQIQQNNKEYMFLILSEDINENSNELVSWNPEMLENGSIVVLGPIAKPLASKQLNNIINRVSTELSKPEYLSLLQQLSKKVAKDKTLRDVIVLGAQSRRYIKPHRCNHRSQLARVYGGPKWLLCTGYLNLNTPSLYD